MAAKDVTKFIIKLENEAAWQSMLESSDKKLVVVDCYQDWYVCCPFDMSFI